ncbi:MAG: RNA 3'-terminal phosphate cyclase [Verrucomicrobiales bacterium]|nr:RNA 3'-terminal phosphate cyclase [Verrucomicrobiales bacterium]
MMIVIDGSMGEGGGQILRTSLSLSLVTGRPVRIERIRAGRPKPGLGLQHLACVEAAAAVGGAEVVGAHRGSTDLEFRPRRVRPGAYTFRVGSAGSATLVLQTVLPPLLLAETASSLEIEGGTHNPFAPPFDFLARSYLPLISRLGPRLSCELIRPGFYPAGGGRFRVDIEPVSQLGSLELLERGDLRSYRATAWCSRVPAEVGERELAVVRADLGWGVDECRLEQVRNPVGPGNALTLEIEAEHVTAVFSAFGERGRPSEVVAQSAIRSAKDWLRIGAPVDEHLADQLLLPLVLGQGGRFRTQTTSSHFVTNLDVIRRFLDREIRVESGLVSVSRPESTASIGDDRAVIREATARPIGGRGHQPGSEIIGKTAG